MVGLFVYPSLLPQEVQLQLLAKSFHRDLSDPQHQTNVHMFHHVNYPPSGDSYFATSAQDLLFEPKDPAVHKSITIQQYLTKKLRWITLGGQYDWTKKVYPDGPPPAFPSDIKDLVESLFPMKAEAAIVNLYSPGDTLSLHRDVSEECDQPLASISLGCDGIFVIGLDGAEPGEPARVATLRLRSGDAVLMSGESRYAWHSVPKILEGTCPNWMQQWPGSEWQEWVGWMERKRINLNVRQMFDSADK
jgi:DNA alkylation damage repair protein AlkB